MAIKVSGGRCGEFGACEYQWLIEVVYEAIDFVTPFSRPVPNGLNCVFQYEGFGLVRVRWVGAWRKHVRRAAPFSGLQVQASVWACWPVVKVTGIVRRQIPGVGPSGHFASRHGCEGWKGRWIRDAMFNFFVLRGSPTLEA